MQKVYKDGSLGEKELYNTEILEKWVKLLEVDHVRVFADVEDKNKIGIDDIITKTVEDNVMKKVDKKLKEIEYEKKKEDILKTYRELRSLK